MSVLHRVQSKETCEREPIKMQPSNVLLALLGLSFLCLTSELISSAEAQQAEQAPQEPQARFRDLLKNMMSVNVPLFYDMTKNGSSLGINVLSGLVKVERGQEAERSGLVGPRPLSVRVFGVPVYERGTRVRSLDAPTFVRPPAGGPKTEATPDYEELPVDP